MVAAKICGLRSAEAVAAAVAHGAAAVGFVLCPASPRNLSPAAAAALAAAVPAGVLRVAVLVDPDDPLADLAAGFADVLQLHGNEPPARVAALRARTGRAVWKAAGVATPADVARAIARHAAVADRLLLDARPPPGAAFPGGHGLAFDPAILAGQPLPPGWILSGGLGAETVAAAARGTGATMVDVSSGVEDAPGVKSLAKIAAFLKAAARA